MPCSQEKGRGTQGCVRKCISSRNAYVAVAQRTDHLETVYSSFYLYLRNVYSALICISSNDNLMQKCIESRGQSPGLSSLSHILIDSSGPMTCSPFQPVLTRERLWCWKSGSVLRIPEFKIRSDCFFTVSSYWNLFRFQSCLLLSWDTFFFLLTLGML